MVSLWVVVETLTCWGIEGPRDSPPFHSVEQGSAQRGGCFPWVVLSEQLQSSGHVEMITPADRHAGAAAAVSLFRINSSVEIRHKV